MPYYRRRRRPISSYTPAPYSPPERVATDDKPNAPSEFSVGRVTAPYAHSGMTMDVLYEERYPTWGDYVRRAAHVSTYKTHACASQERNHPSDSYWDLRSGFAGAIKLAEEGWPEAEEMVSRLSSALFDQVSSRIERDYPMYDVEGDYSVDMARYLQGIPECVMYLQRTPVDGPERKMIRVVVNGFVSCGVSAEIYKARGAAIVALVNLLEFAGHGVELDVVFPMGCSDGPRQVRTWVRVKNADQPVDIGRCAFALAHPSMFRRLQFSVMEQLPPEHARFVGALGGGYSTPLDVYGSDRGDLYISRTGLYDASWSSPAAAEKWVLDQLQAQGVTLTQPST